MKSLAVSLCLLLSFSASALTQYQCDMGMYDLKEEKELVRISDSTEVIITDKEILFRFDGGALSKCNIDVRQGEYIGNSKTNCFFNKEEKHFMFSDNKVLVAYDNCKEVKQK